MVRGPITEVAGNIIPARVVPSAFSKVLGTTVFGRKDLRKAGQQKST